MAEIIEGPKPPSVTTRDIARRFVRHENAVLLLILLVIMGVLAGLTRGATLTRVNILNIMLQSSARGMATIGQTFVILTAGIDLSVGGIALMSSLLSMRDKPRCPWYLCASGKIIAVAQITWSNSLVELVGGRQGDTGKKNSGW